MTTSQSPKLSSSENIYYTTNNNNNNNNNNRNKVNYNNYINYIDHTNYDINHTNIDRNLLVDEGTEAEAERKSLMSSSIPTSIARYTTSSPSLQENERMSTYQSNSHTPRYNKKYRDYFYQNQSGTDEHQHSEDHSYDEEVHSFEGISGQNPLLSPHNTKQHGFLENSHTKTIITKQFVICACIFILIAITLILVLTLVVYKDRGDTFSTPRVATTCDIFCSGAVLATLQTSGLFNDSKSFVDMPLKVDPNILIERFNNLTDHRQETLAKFLEDNFEEIGSDVLSWIPHDYSEDIPLFSTISDPTYLEFAQQLNQLWQELGKEVSADVYENPSRHTILPLLKPYMVVPGGRFREFYYWDSYWIVRGLLICNMTTTAGYIIDNLANFVSIYGYVPNGSRAYYLTRSQPPFLSYMVDAYYQKTLDFEWLQNMLPILDKEYEFYMRIDEHAIKINYTNANITKEYILNRYYSTAKVPRPESYVEDQITANLLREAHGIAPVPTGPNNPPNAIPTFSLDSASKLTDEPLPPSNFTEKNVEKLFSELTASAETGWDFSSRWFEDRRNLSTAFTSHIIPVDLNAIMYGVEVILSRLHNITASSGNLTESERNDEMEASSKYYTASEFRIEGIEAILWSSESNQWQDYNWKDKTLYSDSNYLSNYIPLWTKCFPAHRNTSSIIEALLDSNLILDGGIATSTEDIGQQWDYPNAWPPLQHMVIEGISTSAFSPNPKFNLDYSQIVNSLPTNFTQLQPLYHFPREDSGNLASATLAYYLAARWLNSNFLAANHTGGMWEKYYAPEIGTPGSQGEYIVQLGFGWTNGVALIFLERYGSILEFNFTTTFGPPFHGMTTPSHSFTTQSLGKNVDDRVDDDTTTIDEVHLHDDLGEELFVPDYHKHEELARRKARDEFILKERKRESV